MERGDRSSVDDTNKTWVNKLNSESPNNRDTSVEIDVEDSIKFLRRVWGEYATGVFAIVTLPRGSYRHFFNHVTLWGDVRKYLKELGGENVYYQVLPLAKRPRRGRGSAEYVKRARWLFADLDYKEEVDKADQLGCVERADHELECHYEENGRVYRVKRPPLREVLNSVKERTGLTPAIVVDSGAGYHLYFELEKELEDMDLWRRLESWLVDALNADKRSKDPARILRLPGSYNPRVGRKCVVIHETDAKVNIKELEEKIKREGEQRREQRRERELRELNDSEILRIVDLLKEAYRPGRRQNIALYLSGWMAKIGISPVSAAKVIKLLHERGDSDSLKMRLATVVYSYKKAGVDVAPYAEAIERITGVRPYGLDKEIRESAVKGYSGLQEILEEVLGWERALSIIHELTEIFKGASPYRDSVIVPLRRKRKIFAVADLRAKLIVLAEMTDKGLVYIDDVVRAVPTKVTVYISPIGDIEKFEIVFERHSINKPLEVGPTYITEIVERLKVAGLVVNQRLVNDVLNAIIDAYIKKGRAEVREDIDKPGVYYLNDRLTAVGIDTKLPDREELREALELLNELAEWFGHAPAKFATVVKWGVASAFLYALKQRGVKSRWLYLWGDAGTGKTTLGRIALKIWGQGASAEISGAGIDTPARIGHYLTRGTLPTLVNEPGGALAKDEIVEIIKNAVDTTFARGKYIKGTYVELPSLSPFIFTSNKYLPRDDALLRRFHVIKFSYNERIPPEIQRDFKAEVEPRLHKLSAIGRFASAYVLKKGLPQNDPLALGEHILKMAYGYAFMDVPQWLEFVEEEEEIDPVGEIKEEFRGRFVEFVIKTYVDIYGRGSGSSVGGKLETLLRNNLISGIRLRDNVVYITNVFLKKIGFEGRLKSLAEMLGWEYKFVWMEGSSVRAMVVELEKLRDFLEGRESKQ